jgi:hypothetical protein
MPILSINENRDRQREGGCIELLAVRAVRPDVEHRSASVVRWLQASAAMGMSEKTMEQQQAQPKPNFKRSQTGVVCPRCGHAAARIIGQSDSYAVLYLRCEDCQQTSVAPA